MSLPPSLPPPPPPGPSWPPPEPSEPSGQDVPFGDRVDLRATSADAAFRVPFSTLDAFVALLAYFAGQLVAGLVFGIGLAVTGRPIGSTGTLMVAVGAQVLGLALVAGYLLSRRRLTWRILGPVAPGWLPVAIGVGVGVGGTLVAYLLNGVLAALLGAEDPVEQQLLQDVLAGGAATFLAVVAAVVMAPIAEEVLFRGLMFQALRRRLGLWPAALLSSLAFTLVHVEILTSQPVALAGLFVLGVVFAWSFHRSGSLVVPILAHAVFNGVSLSLAILVDRLDLDRFLGTLGILAALVGSTLPG
jgi:uncharacterized protein